MSIWTSFCCCNFFQKCQKKASGGRIISFFAFLKKKYIMKKSNANFLKSQIKWTGLACTYVQHKLIDKCWKLLQTLIAIFLHFDTVITESFTYRRFAWPFNFHSKDMTGVVSRPDSSRTKYSIQELHDRPI